MAKVNCNVSAAGRRRRKRRRPTRAASRRHPRRPKLLLRDRPMIPLVRRRMRRSETSTRRSNAPLWTTLSPNALTLTLTSHRSTRHLLHIQQLQQAQQQEHQYRPLTHTRTHTYTRCLSVVLSISRSILVGGYRCVRGGVRSGSLLSSLLARTVDKRWKWGEASERG